MSGIKDTLTAQLGRISTPAKEVRDMLAVLADALMSGCYFGPSGAVFWVNGFGTNGNDSYTGRDVDHPKRTIGAALALCTAGKNDHIFVIDYWQPADEDWPIVVNKRQVHIVGLALSNMPYPAIHPTGTTAAFQLSSTGQYGSIENLTIGGGTVGAGIDIGAAGQVDGFLIKKCTFGHSWFGTPVSGIQQKVTANKGGYGNRIEDCLFLGNGADVVKGAITGNGIDLLDVTSAATMMYGTQIINNIFMGLNVGINLARASDSIITGNKFTVDDASDGEAITLSALCLGGLISGNEAMEGTVVMTKNPFKDLGTNHWGLNYRQGVSIMPVTS